MTTTREIMAFDVVIVGAGPAGLSAAIRLKQLDENITVCVIEKGAEVGSHILSGAILEPRALDELIPDWKDKGAPLNVPVKKDHFSWLTQKGAWSLPTPPQMHNKGNYIISLGQLTRWLAEQAMGLGVDIFPGFAAAEIIYEQGQVIGVATGDMGIAKDHTHKDSYQPGVELRGAYTLFAEGCRGSLSESLISEYGLRENVQPQTYALGIKEIWEIDPAKHREGEVFHSIGWPLSSDIYGGSFIYHLDQNRIAYGFVTGLDYTNPYLSPYEESQRFKLHPKIKPLFEGAKRLSYGARALNEGGYQAIPKLIFPGGALIGCGAGFLNVPKIKGTHTAMKSGMLAAEAVSEALKAYQESDGAGASSDVSAADQTPAFVKREELTRYPAALEASWVYDELYRARNIRPSFYATKGGLLTRIFGGLGAGLIRSAIDTFIFRGKAPWTKSLHADHTALKKAADCAPISYPKPDGIITFDRLTSVSLTATNHEEDQPSHLKILNESTPVAVNYNEYGGPETRYCPAGVYEFLEEEGGPKLHINAQNCIHCKTCDIKDPTQNIKWRTPEGSGGPRYGQM